MVVSGKRGTHLDVSVMTNSAQAPPRPGLERHATRFPKSFFDAFLEPVSTTVPAHSKPGQALRFDRAVQSRILQIPDRSIQYCEGPANTLKYELTIICVMYIHKYECLSGIQRRLQPILISIMFLLKRLQPYSLTPRPWMVQTLFTLLMNHVF